MTHYVRDAKVRDIAEVFSTPRDSDLADRELIPDVLGNLLQAVQLGPMAKTVIRHGSPIAMFGVARLGSLMSKRGFAWLIATDEIFDIQLGFLKQTRSYVAEMLQHCPELVTLVNKDNSTNIRWLEWCGFTVYPEYPSGRDGFYLAILEA